MLHKLKDAHLFICDEAHSLNNTRTQIFSIIGKFLMSVPPRVLLISAKSEYKELKDMFNLFQILRPGIFSSAEGEYKQRYHYSARNKRINEEVSGYAQKSLVMHQKDKNYKPKTVIEGNWENFVEEYPDVENIKKVKESSLKFIEEWRKFELSKIDAKPTSPVKEPAFKNLGRAKSVN